MFLMGLILMSVFHSFLGENSPLHAYYHGDIIIGGLFPIHLKTNRTNTSGPLSCSDYDLQMFLRSQAMIYAIREINLPNITIGYDIYDTCGDAGLAVRATLELLKNQSDPQSCLLPAEAQMKVVIGERYSEVSIAVARIVALSSVAQISYASTSEFLRGRFKFPTFLRTVPSDKYQTRGIAKLVKTFLWKTVSIVGSDDEYGLFGSSSLEDILSRDEKICIEFVQILSADFMTNNSQTQTELTKLLEIIKNSSAEAIIIFTKDTNAEIILEAAIKHKVNRTWIASDAWSSSPKISTMPGIELAGQVFGLIFKQNEVPGFKDYVLSMFNGTKNAILEDYLMQNPLCLNQSEEGRKKCLEPSFLASYIDQDESYSIYLAVKVIGEGLRRLLKCDNHHCERSSKFTALELLSEIQRVNFNVGTTHVSFERDGDPSLGYDIVYWNTSEFQQGAKIETIGEYSPDGEITVTTYPFKNMINDTVSIYNCSKTCAPGYELQLERMCCGVCYACVSGQFSPGKGSNCKPCMERQYSSKNLDQCLNKTHDFLPWSNPFSIILCSLAATGIIVTVAFAVLFAVNLGTPAVKAVGGYMCFLELLSLQVGFCLTFTFLDKPTKNLNCVGLPLFGIVFTLCIACILANLFQILLGFNFDLTIGPWIKKLNHPLMLVAVVSAIQVAVSVSWLIFNPPIPQEIEEATTILHQCDVTSFGYFSVMLVYNGCLALICFLFAFKGRQLPDVYKNASLITISMMLFMVMWIIFLPLYLTMTGKYKPAVEGAAILTSCFSILFSHMAPKCHIILFRKELNQESAITEYIRKHYERKGIPVMGAQH